MTVSGLTLPVGGLTEAGRSGVIPKQECTSRCPQAAGRLSATFPRKINEKYGHLSPGSSLKIFLEINFFRILCARIVWRPPRVGFGATGWRKEQESSLQLSCGKVMKTMVICLQDRPRNIFGNVLFHVIVCTHRMEAPASLIWRCGLAQVVGR